MMHQLGELERNGIASTPETQHALLSSRLPHSHIPPHPPCRHPIIHTFPHGFVVVHNRRTARSFSLHGNQVLAKAYLENFNQDSPFTHSVLQSRCSQSPPPAPTINSHRGPLMECVDLFLKAGTPPISFLRDTAGVLFIRTLKSVDPFTLSSFSESGVDFSRCEICDGPPTGCGQCDGDRIIQYGGDERRQPNECGFFTFVYPRQNRVRAATLVFNS